MNWTYKNYLEVRKDALSGCKKKFIYNQYNFFYAVALYEMKKFNGDYRHETDYLARCMRSKTIFWVHGFNVRSDVKKHQVFVCGEIDGICGVEAATTVFSMPKYYNISRTALVRQFLNRKIMKRENKIYDWYEKEISEIDKKMQQVTNDMSNNFCEINLDENKKVEYLLNVKEKHIKTKYGQKNKLYDENIKINYSPFDKLKTVYDLKKYSNRKEFEGCTFPLYEFKKYGHTYLFEKQDFELIENKNEAIEIGYINKWEDALILLSGQKKSRKRWVDRCKEKIKIDVENKYKTKMPPIFSRKRVKK